MMSRAVTGHAASIGISGAALLHAGRSAGPRVRLAGGLRQRRPHRGDRLDHRRAGGARPRTAGQAGRGCSTALFDFRPVLRNRSAFAYSLAYCVHTLEMNALRGWGVAFLAWVAGEQRHDGRGCCRRTVVITVLGLLGTLTSVLGNEASIRFGRRRLIVAAMVLSIVVGARDRLRRLDGLLARRRADRGLRHDHLARLLVAHRRRGRRRRSGAPRRHARRAFDAGLRRRLRRTAGDRLDTRCSRAACRLWPGAWPSAWSPLLMALALVAFIAIRPRELEGDRGG